ncbi:MAG: hypothetical protein KC646_07650 [Candidatus Cloacimonetes bacterium]|nr:hypothetical protein [Candidatus Cloacimonadota bacterium]
MYAKLFTLILLQSITWANPIGFSFGKINESPRQNINQSLSQVSSSWRVEQVNEREVQSSTPEIHPNFIEATEESQRPESEPEVEEQTQDVILDDSQLGGVSLHEMFVASPSYVANIFDIAQQNNYELDESLYTSTPASSLSNDSDLEADETETEADGEDEDAYQSVDNTKSKTTTIVKDPSKKPPKKKVTLPNDNETTLKKENTLKKSKNPSESDEKKKEKKINDESKESE